MVIGQAPPAHSLSELIITPQGNQRPRDNTDYVSSCHRHAVSRNDRSLPREMLEETTATATRSEHAASSAERIHARIRRSA